MVCALFPVLMLAWICPPPAPLDPHAEQRILADIAASIEVEEPEPPEPIGEPWASLADCESGDWIDRGASFVEGSARWHSGHSDPELDERPPWSNGLFYGGLQFEPASWEWAVDVGGHVVPGNPADATPHEQVAVAETLVEIHPFGWGAWPRCSRLVGLR